jgi:glycosyltransferase involved in cell wall biosynthesis
VSSISGLALVLSSYPVARPVHGGQRRIAALVSAYRESFDAVETVAIYNPFVYGSKDAGRNDLAAPPATRALIAETPELEDLFLGRSPAVDSEVRAHMARLLNKYQPSYVIFEQPYLYLGMRDLIAGMSRPPRVVYSSQNIESAMKEAMYASTRSSLSSRASYDSLEEITRLEADLAVRADAVIAVSASDADALRKLGARSVVVVPNGIQPSVSDEFSDIDLRQALTNHRVTSYALFAGSAHLPNATGLLDMVGTRLGYLPRHQGLFLAGDVGSSVRVELEHRDPFYGSAFWRRARDFGRVSDEMLASMILRSSLILLPITEGGGSNLKTAEAIYSGKPVLGTTHAFRGFEQYADLSSVTIEDDPERFRDTIPRLLAEPLPSASADEIVRRSGVLWSSATKSLSSDLASALRA